jgi:hypothetical protein
MLRVVAVLVGQDPFRYSLRSFRQTTSTLIERAGAEVEEGNPYWRFFQGWMSVEAPKRYVNEQLRPVNALDVIGLVGLTDKDVSAAALPSSRRTLWITPRMITRFMRSLRMLSHLWALSSSCSPNSG